MSDTGVEELRFPDRVPAPPARSVESRPKDRDVALAADGAIDPAVVGLGADSVLDRLACDALVTELREEVEDDEVGREDEHESSGVACSEKSPAQIDRADQEAPVHRVDAAGCYADDSPRNQADRAGRNAPFAAVQERGVRQDEGKDG